MEIFYVNPNILRKKHSNLIRKTSERLCQKILDYNKPIEKIFNDEILKHEVYENGFYVFKNGQIRLLYRVHNEKLEIHDYFLKDNHRQETCKFVQFARYLEKNNYI